VKIETGKMKQQMSFYDLFLLCVINFTHWTASRLKGRRPGVHAHFQELTRAAMIESSRVYYRPAFLFSRLSHFFFHTKYSLQRRMKLVQRKDKG
jgi:hypothetical protein